MHAKKQLPMLAMLYNIVQSGIAIFSLYSLKHEVDMNISKQISKSYGNSVILENLNSVKFSIHALIRKMYCWQNETILYYGNYGKTRIQSQISRLLVSPRTEALNKKNYGYSCNIIQFQATSPAPFPFFFAFSFLFLGKIKYLHMIWTFWPFQNSGYILWNFVW